MRIIELRSPRPRTKIMRSKRFGYLTDQTIYLPVPSTTPGRNIFDVVANRRTTREFAPLDLDQVSSLLWHSAKTSECIKLNSSRWWEHRPVISTGGCHPTDIWLFNRNSLFGNWWVYDNLAHSLTRLKDVPSKTSAVFTRHIDSVVPVGSGTILWFVSQFELTASKYHHAESLIWRDSGALLATVSVIAEALSFNSCPLGVTGTKWISQMVPRLSGHLMGVGGCLIGGRPLPP